MSIFFFCYRLYGLFHCFYNNILVYRFISCYCLSYLQKFAFDKVKIDRLFIKEITKSADQAAIVQTIVNLAFTLGMTTVVDGDHLEGVFTDGDLRRAIDAAAGAVDAARAHAALHDLTIDYRCLTAEALAAEGARFDVVVASEVLEHVASLHAFCAAGASLLKPEGAFLATTINRTTRALLGAKLAAEYVLRWAPVGTHDWRKFVRPDELRSALGGHGLVIRDLAGLRFRPLTNSFEISGDISINYGCLASHRERETDL